MLRLTKIDDPRDDLEATRRMDLVRYANANGLKHITDQMPHWLIVEECRRNGLTQPPVPRQMLGVVQSPSAPIPMASEKVGEMSLNEHLRREWEAQQRANDPVKEREAEAAPVVNPGSRSGEGLKRLAALRKEAKARGIKMSRKETTNTLLQKLGRLDG